MRIALPINAAGKEKTLLVRLVQLPANPCAPTASILNISHNETNYLNFYLCCRSAVCNRHLYLQFGGCEPIEAELTKYPEMSVFLAGRTGFRGIRFNLDTNYYSFAFSTNFGTAETYFAAVDTDATRAGWRLVSAELRGRVYTRKKDAPIGVLQLEQITLLYDPEKKEVTLIREDATTQK